MPHAALSATARDNNVQIQGCGPFRWVKGIQESCSFYNLFRPPQRDGVVQLPQRLLRHGAVRDFNHLLNEFTHSELCFSFKPRDRKSSVPHSYVTEDLSKCSFGLSAGGGPRHLARVDGGGDLSWSPQIIRTMEQMTVDKLQRVGWPGGGGGINLLTDGPPHYLYCWKEIVWKIHDSTRAVMGLTIAINVVVIVSLTSFCTNLYKDRCFHSAVTESRTALKSKSCFYALRYKCN